MIRYPINAAGLEQLIDAHAPTWRRTARRKAQQCQKAGCFVGTGSPWSAVKAVYVDIQCSKCVYCERKLRGKRRGLIEYDVEHYRPKSAVRRWPNSKHSRVRYKFKTGGDSKRGYYWLAHDMWNYAASCKTCNSPIKSNYFPIEGRRGPKFAGVLALKKELPLLCYPIGDIDDDPESLISFDATTAVPVARAGTRSHRRARVIIDFFELNDEEILHRERARTIILLGSALRKLDEKPGDRDAARLVKRLVSGEEEHTACARAHASLWARDKRRAKRIVKSCISYAASGSGPPPP